MTMVVVLKVVVVVVVVNGNVGSTSSNDDSGGGGGSRCGAPGYRPLLLTADGSSTSIRSREGGQALQ